MWKEYFKQGRRLRLPIEDRVILEDLKCGELVLLDGWLLCGRDATHRRILTELKKGFSFDFINQFIYYVGPTPAPPGKVVGSVGPTTSGRMDSYMEEFLKLGLAGSMGKGKRSKKVVELLSKYKAVYLATFGGAGAFLSQFVLKVETIAWEELGPEAFFRIKVKDFPAVVINTTRGEDFYSKVNG